MKIEKKIPAGWRLVKLGSVATYINGRAFKPKEWEVTGLPIIRIQNLNKDRAKYNYTSQSYESKYKVVYGDLLFSWSASLGVYLWKGGDAWLNQHIFKVLPKDDCDKIFLYYTLDKTIAELYSKAHGSGMVHVTKGKFESTEILLPPIQQQKFIVRKIEELFSELDKGVENLKTAQQQLQVYRQSVLKWAFEGRLTNENFIEGEIPIGWKWVDIAKIISSDKHSLKAGPFGSALKKEFYVKKGYKVYGQEQVISGNPYYGNYYINDNKYKELNSNKVAADDILISLVGTVGKVLILPENCEPGIINPRLIKISLNRDKYLPKFFKYYFESATAKNHYSSKARGTTMDVLNIAIIKTIPFPICDLEEQLLTIQEIENRLSVSEKLEETILTALEQAETLRQSILKNAFEGKLSNIVNSTLSQPATKNANAEWQRKVLAGKIIFSYQKGGYIGRTKLQKLQYLCENFAQLDIETNYIKEAAGPLDSEFLYSFIDEAKTKGWLEEEQNDHWYRYNPGATISELTKDYVKYFRSSGGKVNFVLGLLHDKDTNDAELIATIYAIWNNYIIQAQELTPALLVKEVYSWATSKAKFKENEITNMWHWMKAEKLVPSGWGKIIA